jgi:dipeptidyl aminopeptidase/acylaminoacyl peptidase
VLSVGGFVAVKHLLPDPPLAAVTAAAAEVHELGGDEPAVILTPKAPSRGIVLYVHGNKQTEREVLSGLNVAPLTAELLKAGYTVVSSRGAGNAWGNPASLRTYQTLISYVRQVSPVDDLYLMGESMGGLASLKLAGSDPQVKAWIGFYPVCDTRTLQDQEDLREGIADAYPDGKGLETVTPVAIPQRVPLLFFASPDDTRVPKSSNTDACAAKSKKAAVVTTEGNHGNASNFQADKVLAFFDAA